MEKKQTAIEWVFEQLKRRGYFGKLPPYLLFEQAKEMEKEQMKEAFVECWKSNVPDGVECKLDAEQYYNKTFKSK